METSKLLIITTIGPENAEKASLPFVLATASQALDVEVTVFLQSSAVVLAKQGEAGIAKGFQPLGRCSTPSSQWAASSISAHPASLSETSGRTN